MQSEEKKPLERCSKTTAVKINRQNRVPKWRRAKKIIKMVPQNHGKEN